MSPTTVSELDAERTVIIALLEGRVAERAELVADYEARLNLIASHIDWLQQRRQTIDSLLQETAA